MGFEIQPNGVGKMRCADWGEVGWPTPIQLISFLWWRRQIVAIDDYPYGGIDFQGDLDMPLPPGSAYEEIGTKSRLSLFLKKFKLFNFFVFS